MEDGELFLLGCCKEGVHRSCVKKRYLNFTNEQNVPFPIVVVIPKPVVKWLKNVSFPPATWIKSTCVSSSIKLWPWMSWERWVHGYPPKRQVVWMGGYCHVPVPGVDSQRLGDARSLRSASGKRRKRGCLLSFLDYLNETCFEHDEVVKKNCGDELWEFRVCQMWRVHFHSWQGTLFLSCGQGQPRLFLSQRGNKMFNSLWGVIKRCQKSKWTWTIFLNESTLSVYTKVE